MSFNSTHVMNSILERSFKEGRQDMTPMKAQKILFYTHGWHLAITGEPAISDTFKVWQYGPVEETIYHDLKRFGSSNITSYIGEYDPDSKGVKTFVVNYANKSLYDAIDIAWEKYIGLSAVNLSAMTHHEGTPWYVTEKNGDTEISNKLIQEYFVGLTRQ